MATNKSPQQSKFSKESEEAQGEELAKRSYMMHNEAWEKHQGQEFGGQADVLDIKEDEVAGPFTYAGHQQMETDLGETTSHTGIDEDGTSWRLPIQATFLRAMDQAQIRHGDVFAIKRYPNQTKKRGAGKGNAMAIYAIKVIERSANPKDDEKK